MAFTSHGNCIAGKLGGYAPHRHCGLDLQSRGEARAAVILASRQYPQGGVTTRQHNQSIALSLDERGIKGEGDNDAEHRPNHVNPRQHQHRHSRVGGNPQGGV